MGRLKEAASEAAREFQPGPRCTVGKLRGRLLAPDSEELDGLLDDLAGFTAETIRAALLREADALGVDPMTIPTAQTLQRHRLKRCRCEPQ